MDSARILTELPITMALRPAVVFLLIILVPTSLTTLSAYSSNPNYSLPALKSICKEYACSAWSWLFSLLPAQYHHSVAEPNPILSPRNIFLLVNLIILALFVNIHIQQQQHGAIKAAGSADQRLSSRKKRQLHQHTTRQLLVDDKHAVPSEKFPSLAGAEKAAMSREDFPAGFTELRPLQAATMESLEKPYQTQYGEERTDRSVAASEVTDEEAYEASMSTEISFVAEVVAPVPSSEDRESSGVDPQRTNGCDADQIILEEDGRLRLVDGKGLDAGKTGDGGLKSIEADTKGSDAGAMVVEEDGRLRLIDRPLPAAEFRSKPEKSLSDTFCANGDNQDTNREINEEIHSLKSTNENHNNQNNLNHGDSSNHEAANASCHPPISRPIRVKKADSLDATWQAINKNKGDSTLRNTKDKKHLIRQRSRQGFKPSTRRDSYGSHSSSTASSKGSSVVRREPSIGQEELNAKVESFIARFNEQIRIQRQESILSFMQMVDRGA